MQGKEQKGKEGALVPKVSGDVNHEAQISVVLGLEVTAEMSEKAVMLEHWQLQYG